MTRTSTAQRLMILTLALSVFGCGAKKDKEQAASGPAARDSAAAVSPIRPGKSDGDVPTPISNDINVLKSLNPNVPATQLNLGDYYLKQGDLPAAIAAYRQAIQLDPKYVQGYNNLGLALARSGDSAAAEAQFKKAIDLDGTFAKAFTNLGTFYVRHGNLEKGLFALRSAVRADSMDPVACSNLGVALRRSGDLNGALEMYLRALSLNPARAVDHLHIANVYYDRALYDDAYERYGKALEVDPTLTEAQKFREAMEASDQLVRNKPR